MRSKSQIGSKKSGLDRLFLLNRYCHLFDRSTERTDRTGHDEHSTVVTTLGHINTYQYRRMATMPPTTWTPLLDQNATYVMSSGVMAFDIRAN